MSKRRRKQAPRRMHSIRVEIPLQSKVELRFWSRVNKDGPVPAHMPHLGQCWNWITKPSGRVRKWPISGEHPGFKINGVTIPAHRVSLYIATGGYIETEVVMHLCDNKRCVNPAHLKPGTQSENIKDYCNKFGSCRYNNAEINNNPVDSVSGME